MTGTIYIMAYRQLKRFLRAKSRVVSTVVNPLIWLVFFGLGWANAFSFPAARALFGGLDYLSYLAPGIVAMTVFSASFISGVSVLWDKEFGFLKEVLVAPASRSAAILGRALGDAAVAVVQGAIILALSFAIAPELSAAGVLPAIGYSFLMALGFTSAGILIALRMTSMEGFHMIVSFLMFPLVFLSSAFYPLDYMPTWMRAVAYVNPLTYAVDGVRGCLVGVSSFNPWVDATVLTLLSAVLMLAAMAGFERATIS